MAEYGLYFAETDESANREDSDELIVAEEDGWERYASGSLAEVLDWIVDSYNDDDLPNSNNHWMRFVKTPDDSIADGEMVVL